MMDKINTQYNKAVKLIKSAILQNQLEAAKAVNRQILALYYGVGKYPWIEWDENTKSGKFLHKPERADIPENIKEQLIVELYSKQ